MNKNLAYGGICALMLGIAGSAIAKDNGMTKSQQNQNPPSQSEPTAPATTQSQFKSVKLSSLDTSQIKDIQTQMKDLGLYTGTVDGKLGAQTKAALVQYMRTQLAFVNQGRISDYSLMGLGFNKDDIQRVRGVDEKSGNQRQPTKGTEQQKPNQQKPQGTQKSQQKKNP